MENITNAQFGFSPVDDDCWEADMASWSESVLSEKTLFDIDFKSSHIQNHHYIGHTPVNQAYAISNCSFEALSIPFDTSVSDDDFSVLLQDDISSSNGLNKVRNGDVFDGHDIPAPYSAYCPRRYQYPPETETPTLPRSMPSGLTYYQQLPQKIHLLGCQKFFSDDGTISETELSDDDEDYEERGDENGEDDAGSDELDEQALRAGGEDLDPQAAEYNWLIEAVEEDDKGLLFKVHAEGGSYMEICPEEVRACIQNLLSYDEGLVFLVRKLDKSFMLVEASKVVNIVSSIIHDFHWENAGIIGTESESSLQSDAYEDLSVMQDPSSRSLPPVVTPSRDTAAFRAGQVNCSIRRGQQTSTVLPKGGKFKLGWRALTGRAKLRAAG